MNKRGQRTIRPPFFEIGPKTYVYGKDALAIALAADEASKRYGVDVIFSAQYTDIRTIAEATENIFVFAQHMDSIKPGRGIGKVLPEALREAGAEGVLLNHAEMPLDLYELDRCITRAREAGLLSLVCAGTPAQGAAVACLGPDMIIAESPELIGAGKRGPEDKEAIREINETIHRVAPGMLILHAAGISDENDVYQVVRNGADATGSTSGIMKAEDPCLMTEKMIEAAARAYRERKEEADNGLS